MVPLFFRRSHTSYYIFNEKLIRFGFEITVSKW